MSFDGFYSQSLRARLLHPEGVSKKVEDTHLISALSRVGRPIENSETFALRRQNEALVNAVQMLSEYVPDELRSELFSVGQSAPHMSHYPLASTSRLLVIKETAWFLLDTQVVFSLSGIPNVSLMRLKSPQCSMHGTKYGMRARIPL